MMTKIITKLLLLCIVGFSSCTKLEEIKLVGVSDFKIESNSKVSLQATIDNPTRRTFQIDEVNFEVFHNGSHLLSLKTNNEIEIVKQELQKVYIPIYMKLKNPLGAVFILTDIEKNIPKLSIEGEMRVKSGALKHKIAFKKMPLTDFIDNFGKEIKF